MSVCFLAGGVLKTLQVSAFTLVWTHSIAKVDWQEDWRVTPDALDLVSARVKGTGPGMEPPPEARLRDGWWQWSPNRVLPEVVLGQSGAAGDWRICVAGQDCRTLSDIFGHPLTEPITMSRCDDAVK